MWYTTWVRENAPCGFPQNTPSAGMVELVDSVDLGSTAKSVQVRVLLPAPNQNNPNQVFPVGDGFGLFVFFGRFGETHFRNGVIKRPASRPRGPRKKKQISQGSVMERKKGVEKQIIRESSAHALVFAVRLAATGKPTALLWSRSIDPADYESTTSGVNKNRPL